MKNKQSDLDALFAQFREEATPTPLQNLIEPRASGALFALKNTLPLSLTSRALWLGLGCAGALAVGGVLYMLKNTARQETPATSAQHSAQTAPVEHLHTPDVYSPAEVQENVDLSTVGNSTVEHPTVEYSTVEQSIVEHPTVEYSTVEKSTVGISTIGGRTTPASMRKAVRDGGTAQGAVENAAARADATAEQHSSADITAAHYRMGVAFSAPALSAAPVPVEEFPLPVLGSESGSRHVSLTLNGVALLADIVQMQGEVRLGDNLSGGVLFGVGNVAGPSADQSFPLLTAGAQVNYYLAGDFGEGLQLGAQVLFSSTDMQAQRTFLYENGRMLSLVPYAGYKLIMDSGMTLNLQAGVGAATPVFIPAESGTATNSQYKWRVSTRLQLNVGWSL